ncbi:uncharacterized protein TRAVEDRAFT_30032 [Trametes versicolor FP-101664 SS1]|uniref:uncharacterized protein n=1 Tax=Trametes versicolor (strain FP-101664) TaxID=717944 RepID=UPI0004621A7E|nr:uncharacterized protein TRAVEDRAFT_30032 [Trametes versicolor FP-101664 SS1]EIW56500.1 hypothetical protein TRAVEDRAFT_30032 [Trametes versicolor FP-101664 SS1]
MGRPDFIKAALKNIKDDLDNLPAEYFQASLAVKNITPRTMADGHIVKFNKVGYTHRGKGRSIAYKFYVLTADGTTNIVELDLWVMEPDATNVAKNKRGLFDCFEKLEESEPTLLVAQKPAR